MPLFPHPQKVLINLLYWQLVLSLYFCISNLFYHFSLLSDPHMKWDCLLMDILFAWTFLFILMWSSDSCAWNFAALFVSAWNCLCAWKKKWLKFQKWMSFRITALNCTYSSFSSVSSLIWKHSLRKYIFDAAYCEWIITCQTPESMGLGLALRFHPTHALSLYS